MNKYLVASLLIIGLASPAFAADEKTAQTHLVYAGNGHPDPCCGRWDSKDTAMPKRGLVLKAASRVTITTTEI
jgi:hypothetical protein